MTYGYLLQDSHNEVRRIGPAYFLWLAYLPYVELGLQLEQLDDSDLPRLSDYIFSSTTSSQSQNQTLLGKSERALTNLQEAIQKALEARSLANEETKTRGVQMANGHTHLPGEVYPKMPYPRYEGVHDEFRTRGCAASPDGPVWNAEEERFISPPCADDSASDSGSSWVEQSPEP